MASALERYQLKLRKAGEASQILKDLPNWKAFSFLTSQERVEALALVKARVAP